MSVEEAESEDCPTICCGALQPAATSAEARTEVGAALSAKEMRTHWEGSPEGKEVRDQWELVSRACKATAPPGRTYVYDQLS